MTFEAQVPFPRLYIAVPLRILSKVYTLYNIKKTFASFATYEKQSAGSHSQPNKKTKKKND